jgi:type I restriction enzyme R subunit
MSLNESIVEDAALEWFGELGYAVGHGPQIAPGEPAAERDSFGAVVLIERLREAIRCLNPAIPEDAREEALRKVLRVAMPSLVQTNRVFHRMLRDGVEVEYPRLDGSIAGDRVRLLDFDLPLANDWFVVNQFTVIEGQHNRRPDIVVFVNGLPLGLIELKNAADEGATIWSAYAQFQTYKAEIPSLLQYNAVLVVSDGLQARIGSLTANQEWFKVWREVDADSTPPSPGLRPPSPSGRGAGGEGSKPTARLELETLIQGVFDPQRFLDLLQHFIVFEEDPDNGTLHKIIAGYHQFHAVNAAVEETVRASGMEAKGQFEEHAGQFWSGKMHGGKPGDRRAGVVWHTQGSGKSFSMLFYAARIIRHPAMQNPTLVVLTDRNDLDDQLFGQFQRCHDILGQTPVQAENRDHLRELLAVASGGVVFTTIQKFMPAAPSPQPSPRVRGGKDQYRGGFDFSGLTERARELRQKQTTAEELLWQLVRNRQLCGAKFRRQHQFGDYICDFFCNEAKLVVECDGAPHDTDFRRKIDQKRDAYLKSQGLTVLRYPNSRILDDTEGVIEEIVDHLPSTSGRGAGGISINLKILDRNAVFA